MNTELAVGIVTLTAFLFTIINGNAGAILIAGVLVLGLSEIEDAIKNHKK